MPLSINVGLSRKASKDYQSTGTSINIVAELDQALLAKPEELQRQIDGLYQQAQNAISRNIGSPDPASPTNGDRGNGRRPTNGNAMTASQRRAILSIADRNKIDVDYECRQLIGVEFDRLSVRQASDFIGRPTKLHFAIITKAKKPIVQLLPVETDANRVAGVTDSIRQVWQAMQSGNCMPSGW